MKDNHEKQEGRRRGFLRELGTGAAALGLASIASAFKVAEPREKNESPLTVSGAKNPADVWFNKVKGKHRVIFDATE
ncbi:MAG TPA: twin-arginine translocation signal domain-containing protein, partial [Saprospiraceae bacterium]|nr:twin-arginine translocation signal domain-containing protein [Saprospiraceae bacterium]